MLSVMMLVNIKAQTVSSVGEVWLGYISSIKLNDKYAIWNDFHFVNNSFFASRQGLTYYITPLSNVTAGYAWVTTTTSFTKKLVRPEHRLWGQFVGVTPLSEHVSYRFRLRYDARFRKKITSQEVLDERIFYSRIRFMNSFRFQLGNISPEAGIHFNMMDELLLNAGRQVNNGIDQNRLYLLLGITKKKVTVLSGYDWRIIPHGNQYYTFRHGVVVWVVHKI